MSTAESDSITSSQIRRFGLYRTIDAKTEEFLRLSRKRQMRQGCACAAISTTITVTVVVSFILIYEYSTISESTPRTTLTPNWVNLMNTSVDDLPFEVKLDKAKTGLDPASIKFLPVILKTLKKHKYFDKMIEESSSPSTLQDIREPIEHISNKNIFSDTRNWMRMPSSRLYTIEYKTSPIVYFKNPTRNIDYFKKVRKIREYQRIMNYVDKMISERVQFGSTQPMAKSIYNIHKNSMTDLTTPMTKAIKYETSTQKPHITKTKPISSNEKRHCSCPKKINEILNKLIGSLHSLLPNFTSNNSSSDIKPCKHRNANVIPEQANILKQQLVSTSKYYDTTQHITQQTTMIHTVPITSTTPYIRQQTITAFPKIDYTLNAIIALLRPSIQQKGVNKNNEHSLKTTTTKNDVERTDANYKLENTFNNIENSATKMLSDSAITMRDFILKNTIQTSKPFLTSPVITEKEYADYPDTTPKIGELNTHNTNNSEYIELIEIKNDSKNQGPNSNDGDKRSLCKDCEKEKENNNELVISSTISSYIESDIHWKSNGITQSVGYDETTTHTVPDSQIKYTKNFTLPDTTQPTTENEKREQAPKSDDITLEEEIEKTSTEEITPEDDLRNLENIIKTLNNSNVYSETTTDNSELYEWELIKIEDKYDTNEDIKSMTPQDRTTYLEIQRSEWKQDDHQDYDNNINQYLFE